MLMLDEDESFSLTANVTSPGYQSVVLKGYLVSRRSDGTYIAPLIPQLFYGADGIQLATWRQNISVAGEQVLLRREAGEPSVPREELYWRRVPSKEEVARAGSNLVLNSSFEDSLAIPWFGFNPGDQTNPNNYAIITNEDIYSGGFSAKVGGICTNQDNTGRIGQLIPKAVLKPNGRYRVSCAIKGWVEGYPELADTVPLLLDVMFATPNIHILLPLTGQWYATQGLEFTLDSAWWNDPTFDGIYLQFKLDTIILQNNDPLIDRNIAAFIDDVSIIEISQNGVINDQLPVIFIVGAVFLLLLFGRR